MGRVWLIVWKVELAQKVELGAQRPQCFCAVHSAEPKAASRANMRHVTHQTWARQTVSSQRNLERKWCQPPTVINISTENMIRPAPTATYCQKGGSPTTAVMLTRRGIPAARPEHTVRTKLRHFRNVHSMSWGGFKYSGAGREYCRYGIGAFLQSRAMLARSMTK
jgi:hypothetical protein